MPFAFTEQGVAMLSGLLNSPKAIEYLEEDISSDRNSYEKQFDELFTAFAKVSASIQSKTTTFDRVQIKGFKNKE